MDGGTHVGKFEKFDERARRALFFARYEASIRRSPAIDSDHLLLGLIREPDNVTRTLYGQFGIDVARIRAAYPSVNAEPIASSGEIPLSEDAKLVLAWSVHEAELQNHSHVQPAHLVLGILRVENSPAARVLLQLGMSYPAAAERVAVLVAERIRTEERPAPLTLRASHLELLGRLADRIEERRAESEILHALLDAIASSPLDQRSFRSLDDLRGAIVEALLKTRNDS
jgi:ATP-dependent Clp protease ATP-binding subunit ClpA